MRQNVPNGTIGTLLARGVSYLKLSKTTLCTPLMENKFGYTYKTIIPSKLIYLGIRIHWKYYFSLEIIRLIELICYFLFGRS